MLNTLKGHVLRHIVRNGNQKYNSVAAISVTRNMYSRELMEYGEQEQDTGRYITSKISAAQSRLIKNRLEILEKQNNDLKKCQFYFIKHYAY